MKKILACLSGVVASFLAVSVALSSTNITADTVAVNSEYKLISYVYYGVDKEESARVGTPRTYYFDYCDEFFLSDATKLNGDMAKMGVGLASAAYEWDEINQVLAGNNGMGFTFVNAPKYAEHYSYVKDEMSFSCNSDDYDRVAYSIAKKQIGDKVVYCVPIKGTGGNAEWYSNFHLGEGPMHAGFKHAAKEVYKDLLQAIQNDPNSTSENTVIFLSGHSRGGAVSNIIARWLNNNVGYEDGSCLPFSPIPRSQVFSYNYAAPAVSTEADHSMKNIYNFINPGDIVPLLPLDQWGYERNGIDITTYSSSACKENVYFQFSKEYGACNSADNSDNYKPLLEGLFLNPDVFNRADVQLIFRLLTYGVLGNGKGRDSLRDICLCDGGKGMTLLGIRGMMYSSSLFSTINIFAFLYGCCAERDEQYISHFEFLDTYAEQVRQWEESDLEEDREKLEAFWQNNSDEIEELETLTEMSISSSTDMFDCEYKLISLNSLTEHAKTKWQEFFDLIFSTNGDVLTLMSHAHTCDFYILWMNTEFWGPNGWSLNQNSLSMTTSLVPNTTCIGHNCFSGCTALSNIIFPDKIMKIGNSAFRDCMDLTGELYIPSSVRTIGSYAFAECKQFDKITISEGVQSLGDNAFENCTGVTDLTMPVNLDYSCSLFEMESEFSKRDWSFLGCKNISHISITGSGEMHNYGYSSSDKYCEATPWYISEVSTLTIDMSDDITSIGNFAFTGLTNNKVILSLPQKLTKIGKSAFSGCVGLFGELAFPNALKEIDVGAFSGCIGISGTLRFPDELTTVGSSAFYGCMGLTGELYIPSNIATIGSNAFANCNQLHKITISEGVQSVGKNAFENCIGVTDLTMPVNLDYSCSLFEMESEFSKRDWSFLGCKNISHISITGSGEMYNYGYSSSDKYCEATPWYISEVSTLTIDMSDDITSIGNFAFTGLTNNKVILSLPQKLTKIGKNAFSGCVGLSGEVLFPNGLKEIDANAFSGCRGLSGTLNLPDELTTLGNSAFAGCLGLTGTVSFPSNLTTIPYAAFSECRGIQRIIIPETIKNVENLAFNNCVGVTELSMPVGLQYACDVFDSEGEFGGPTWSFKGCTKISHIAITGAGEMQNYSPSAKPYYEGTPWQISQSKTLSIDLSDDITSIGNYTFCGMNNLIGDLILPKSLVKIGECAFSSCTRITRVIIHNSLRIISQNAFADCSITDAYYLGTRQKWMDTFSGGEFGFGTIHYLETQVFEATASGNKILLTWDSVDFADGYNLYCSVDGGEKSLLEKVQGTTFEYAITVGESHECVFTLCPVYEDVEGEEKEVRCNYGVDPTPKPTPIDTPTPSTTPSPAPTTATPIPTLYPKPSAPSGVKADPVSASSVNVSWNAVVGADGYQVARAISSSGTYSAVGSVTTTNRVCAGLTAGTTYYFKVRVYKEVDGKKIYGAYSSVVSATTIKVDAPSGVKADPVSASSVNVSWNAVSGADGYQVARATSSNGTYSAVGSVTTTNRVCNGLTLGTTYYFKVRAFKEVNGTKIYSSYSSVVNALPIKISMPGGVKATIVSGTSVNISWKAVNGVDGYQVARATSASGSYSTVGSVTTTNRICAGLTCGSAYYFKVRAYKEVSGKKVYGDYSSVVSVTPKPAAPSNVKAVPEGTTGIKISWSAVSGATGYQVWRATSATGSFTAIGSVTETSRVSTGLKAGTTYYYKVRAYKEVNGSKVYGAYSSVVSSIPKPAAPGAMKATVSSATKVTVSWNAVAGATGYEVYRATSANGTYSKLGTVTTTSRACPGLKTGTKYYFKVRAYVEVNGTKYYSAFGAVVSAVPKA